MLPSFLSVCCFVRTDGQPLARGEKMGTGDAEGHLTFGGQRDLIVPVFSDCETDATGQVCLASKRAIFSDALSIGESIRAKEGHKTRLQVLSIGAVRIRITCISHRCMGREGRAILGDSSWTASTHVLRYCVLETGLLAASPDVLYSQPEFMPNICAQSTEKVIIERHQVHSLTCFPLPMKPEFLPYDPNQ